MRNQSERIPKTESHTANMTWSLGLAPGRSHYINSEIFIMLSNVDLQEIFVC